MIRETLHEVMKLFVPPPAPGERVIVERMEEYKVTVLGFEWIREENRFKIHLDWGEHGQSYVWHHDEGKTWRRFLEVN